MSSAAHPDIARHAVELTNQHGGFPAQEQQAPGWTCQMDRPRTTARRRMSGTLASPGCGR